MAGDQERGRHVGVAATQVVVRVADASWSARTLRRVSRNPSAELTAQHGAHPERIEGVRLGDPATRRSGRASIACLATGDRLRVVAPEHVGAGKRRHDPCLDGRRLGAFERRRRRLEDGEARRPSSPDTHNARDRRTLAAAQRSGSRSRSISSVAIRAKSTARSGRPEIIDASAASSYSAAGSTPAGRSSAGTASHRSIARSYARVDSAKPNATDAARAAATHARSARTGSWAADAWCASAERWLAPSTPSGVGRDSSAAA